MNEADILQHCIFNNLVIYNIVPNEIIGNIEFITEQLACEIRLGFAFNELPKQTKHLKEQYIAGLLYW